MIDMTEKSNYRVYIPSMYLIPNHLRLTTHIILIILIFLSFYIHNYFLALLKISLLLGSIIISIINKSQHYQKIILTKTAIIFQHFSITKPKIVTLLWKEITRIDYNYKLITIHSDNQGVVISRVDFPFDFIKIKNQILNIQNNFK